MIARDLLREITPLRSDCGRLCGRACCEVDDPSAGMLLFPGEERLYDNVRMVALEGFPRAKTPLLQCSGSCDRNDRPLSCRVAPLTPAFRRGAVIVEMDRRCGAVCPLMDYGMQALRADFIQAVREAAAILARDPDCLTFIRGLTAHMDHIGFALAQALLPAVVAPERPSALERAELEPNRPHSVAAEEQRDVQQR